MDWARILAYVTGMVDQEQLARNEYLAAENRILKAQLKGRLQLSDAERAMLGDKLPLRRIARKITPLGGYPFPADRRPRHPVGRSSGASAA